MIIVLGKGKSRSGKGKGVKDYYLYGTNDDRDKKDARIVLKGNLNTLEKTIAVAYQMGYAETYRNIVLSFSEDHIKQETLESIVENFKKQYMAGYNEDEYIFYAEAHLPKIKTKQDSNTNEVIYRKPHIHITVPIYSPKLEKALSLGNHGQRLQELETWKSVTEKKYGLMAAQNSPLKKDVTQVYDTKLQSRKGIIELCNKAIEDNIQDNILDKHSLKMILLNNVEGIESIKESTGKAKTPYFALKMKNSDKVIRLKGALYSSNHLEFMQAREDLLNKQLDSTYYEVGTPRKIPTTLQNQLDTYYKRRCEYVSKREGTARTKLDNIQSKLDSVLSNNNLPTVKKQEDKDLVSVVQSMIQDIKQDVDIKNTNEHYKEYKKTLHPQYMFNLLGVDKERYKVHKVKDEYRIRCGKRNLNIHDFLTKEMHLAWTESKEIMDAAYQQQVLIQSKKSEKITNSFTCYQEKILYSRYKSKIEHALDSYHVKVEGDTVYISSKSKSIDITDSGDTIIAHGNNIKEQVKLMLDIAIAKEWDLLAMEISGDDEFIEEAMQQIEMRQEKSTSMMQDLNKISVNMKLLKENLGIQANHKQTNVDIEYTKTDKSIPNQKTAYKSKGYR